MLENFEDVFNKYITEEGEFECKVVKVRKDKSKNGNPMIIVTLKNEDKGIIRDYFVITDKSKWKYKQFLVKVLGIKNAEDAKNTYKDIDEMTNDILNKSVIVGVSAYNYVTGKNENKIGYEVSYYTYND